MDITNEPKLRFPLTMLSGYDIKHTSRPMTNCGVRT